jgi:hypothetical protein
MKLLSHLNKLQPKYESCCIWLPLTIYIHIYTHIYTDTHTHTFLDIMHSGSHSINGVSSIVAVYYYISE